MTGRCVVLFSIPITEDVWVGERRLATYEVPEFNLGWLGEKIAKLNRKADKLGVQPITMSPVRSRIAEQGNGEMHGAHA